MIKTVIKYPDRMVSVLDNKGEHIPECHDLYAKVKARLLEQAPSDAVFYHAFNTSPILRKVRREEW